MADTPSRMIVHVDFNSREMQEWLAQAWRAGWAAGERCGEGRCDLEDHHNPFNDNELNWDAPE